MSKTLTEQWLDGTLKKGNYYVNAKNIYNGNLYKGEIDHFNGEAHWFRFAGVEEVLAPVPSYDEIKRLQEQLEIATKALKEFKKNEDNYLDFGLTSSWKEVKLNPNRVATKALKEMEGVK